MSHLLLRPDTELARSAYTERSERDEGGFDRWLRSTGGGFFQALRPFNSRVKAWLAAARALEDQVRALDDQDLRLAMARAARSAVRLGKDLPEALALVREGADRSLGLRPFDTQLTGATVLMAGRMAEMQTGEGKTLTAGLGACLAASAGIPVHVVTVNDYLAERDAEKMAPLFRFFGLSSGTIITGMCPADRRVAYAHPITYCTNKELVFDYLKDRVAAGPGGASRAQIAARLLSGGRRGPEMLLRGLHFAIVDEADSVFIDEAKTPLILSEKGPAITDGSFLVQALDIARLLEPERHFHLSEARRELYLLDEGKALLAQLTRPLGGGWTSAAGREQLVAQALRALHLFQRDQHYLVADDEVHIIDEYTGRILPGRTWEAGLHQLIETKEGVSLSEQNHTLARITYQRYFVRYLRLSGMTGTAREVAPEIRLVYELHTVTVAPNRPSKRRLLPSRCYADTAAKWQAVADEAQAALSRGQPVLVGTRSVEASEALSAVLQQRQVPHDVLNARQDEDEAERIARAGERGALTVATNMAGRGTDIHLGAGVAEAGGLHVILTEFSDSARIDRQLIGRCARQGDPGSAVALVALDDALFVEHGGLRLKLVRALARRIGAPAVPAALIEWLRRGAQKKAGAIHARTRRQTLAQDRKLDSTLAFAGNQI